MTEFKDNQWLDHLPKEVMRGTPSSRLDSYMIALEAWRRGLSIEWFAYPTPQFSNLKPRKGRNYIGRLIAITSDKRAHYFFLSRGDKNTYKAFRDTQDKIKAKELLLIAGIPVAPSKEFSAEANDDKIIEYFNSLEYPVVLKPSNKGMGKGVFTDIKDKHTFIKALLHVRHELDCKSVLVEKYVPGKDYRVYVIEDRIVGATHRVAANVIGDGIHTIKELINIKNKMKLQNPYSKPIKVDPELLNFIKHAGYGLYSKPPKNQRVYLRGKCNASAGGDTVDATDNLSPAIKRAAVKALQATGLRHGGVDFIVNNNCEDKFVVLELGSAAETGLHVFPDKGIARDVPAALVDYYFPESKGGRRAENVYFDLGAVLNPLRSRTASVVKINPAPNGNLYAKRFLIKGKVQRVGYRNWIRREAWRQELHGHAINEDDGAVEVVVAGEKREKVDSFKNVCKEGPPKAIIKDVTVHEYNKPVMVGFFVKGSSVKQRLKLKKRELRRTKRKLLIIQQRYREIKQKYEGIKQSRTWRYTYPLRKFARYLSKLGVK